jgi:DNA-directed RNA polymerase I subunit RPA49
MADVEQRSEKKHKKDKKDKKRKRHTEGADEDATPSKTRVVDRPSTLIKIQHLEADRRQGPVVATSAGLAPAGTIKYKAFSSIDESARTTPELLLHSSDHSKIDYTARENQDVGAASVLKHYVGVFDPTTHTLKVVEARKVSVRNTLRSEEHEAREENAAEVAKAGGARSLRQDLGMTFGTKKAKKAIASLKENAIAPVQSGDLDADEVRKAIKADPTQAAIMESMVAAAASAPTAASTQSAIDDAKPRPKANEKAERPQDVYPIADILGEETQKEVKVKFWVDAVDAGEAVQTTSRFVANRLNDLVNNDAIPELKVLRFAYALIKFYQFLLPAKKGKKLPPPEKLRTDMAEEAPLLDTIKRRFTEHGCVKV